MSGTLKASSKTLPPPELGFVAPVRTIRMVWLTSGSPLIS